MSDFFDSHAGVASQPPVDSLECWLKDRLCDARLALSGRLHRIEGAASATPRKRVLIVGVAAPSRPGQLEQVTAAMANSRHSVDVSTIDMKPQGKFANIDEAIATAAHPLSSYDWLVVTDDDVALPPRFLDRYLALAAAASLSVSQPAHCYASYASYAITRRRLGSLVRRSGFIEIGPVTVIRADAFADLIPFPPSRWCYGIDAVWSELAVRRDWTMGIVGRRTVSVT